MPDVTIYAPGVAVSVINAEPAPGSAVRYVETAANGGSDSNSGLTRAAPFLTVLHAVDTLRASLTHGVVKIGPGIFDLPDTLNANLGIQVWGRGIYDPQGTVLNYTGPDDGRPAIRTGNPLNPASEFAGGKMGGFQVRGRAGMTGGGVAMDLRNLQNMAHLCEIRIEQWPTGKGFYFRDDKTPYSVGVAYPGFTRCERLWAFGSPYPFYLESGFSSLTFDTCGIDMTAETVQGFTCTHKRGESKTGVSATSSGTGSSTVATFSVPGGPGILFADLFEITGLPGYNGTWKVKGSPSGDTWQCSIPATQPPASGGTFKPLYRAIDLDLVLSNFKIEGHTANSDGYVFDCASGATLIGCTARTPNSNKSAFVYSGTPKVSGNTPDLVIPPLVMLNCSSVGYSKWLSAPNFPGLDVPATKTGGVITRGNFVR